jgi:integrase
MPKRVDTLIIEAESHLDGCGYAETTKREYRRTWREFAEDCRALGTEFPSRADGDAFAARRGWLRRDPSRREAAGAGAVRRLFDLAETGAFGRAPRRAARPPASWGGALDGHLAGLAARGVGAATLTTVRGRLIGFLAFLVSRGADSPEAVTVGLVHRFAAGLSGAPATRAQVVYAVRAFLGFLVERHGADRALQSLFPVVLTGRDATLPSVYSADEVRRAVEAADLGRPSGRRDKAIMLLAALLGMRAGEIRRLTLDQIDWEGRKVSFTQSKTGRRIDLPLPDECAFAVLDYLREERPDCDDPHVFIRSRAPLGPFSDGHSLHRVVAGCFARAGVDTSGRRHGAHALRHSAAVNMLAGGAPYPVISGVLGHASANTTRRYLRVDVERLRALSLEVPDER